MPASGLFVCHQARVLFVEGLARLTTPDERREALRKLLVELLAATADHPELEKSVRIAYNELSAQLDTPPDDDEDESPHGI
jgi:hypothetical protein